MFGSTKRAERRRQEALKAAQRAAQQRSNFMDAMEEALGADTDTTLYVGNTKLTGKDGHCTVYPEHWYGIDNFWCQILSYRNRLGRRYKVTGGGWGSVERIPFGVQLELATGYPNPRLHAIEHETTLVTLASEADVEKNRRAFYHPHGHWISISRR